VLTYIESIKSVPFTSKKKNMKILLIEDEYHAQKRLENIIKELRPTAEVLAILDSVEDAVEWLESNSAPDLLFLDIQLSDGLSFEIFTKIKLETPVIFTTAFDEYAIKAFKINSIDYLLKPVEEEELEAAFQKYESLYQKQTNYDVSAIENLVKALVKPQFKERFLIKTGQSLSYVPMEDVAYFYSENSYSFLKTKTGKKHILDQTMEELVNMVDPQNFFRINRKVLVKIDSIQQISPYFNSRLILKLNPKNDFEAIVSREKVKGFRGWIDQ